jgi:hypothetical protein
MRIIRASEIGLYLYCQRAWWYRRQGFESENQAALNTGLELHHQHGQTVFVSGCLRWLAYTTLLAAFISLAVYLALRWL